MKIVLTNWISIAVMFVSLFLVLLVTELLPDFITLKEALYNSFGTVIVYYMSFWIAFLLLMVLFDVLFFSLNKQPQYTNYKLIVEWFLISLSFIYWFIPYSKLMFLVATLAFALSQFLRRSSILRVLQTK